jgi:hypothetical protein
MKRHVTLAVMTGLAVASISGLGGGLTTAHASGGVSTAHASIQTARMTFREVRTPTTCYDYYENLNSIPYGSGTLDAYLEAAVLCNHAYVTWFIGFSTSTGDLVNNSRSSLTVHTVTYGWFLPNCERGDYYDTNPPAPSGNHDYGQFQTGAYDSYPGCTSPQAGDSGSFIYDTNGKKYTFPYLYVAIPGTW